MQPFRMEFHLMTWLLLDDQELFLPVRPMSAFRIKLPWEQNAASCTTESKETFAAESTKVRFGSEVDSDRRAMW